MKNHTLLRYGFLVVLCIVPAIYWTMVQYSENICNKAHCVDIHQIQKSLNNAAPMSVGFDIDETILFASPVFYHVSNELCHGKVFDCMKTHPFWEAVNQLDSFSLPKHKSVELVKMHLQRGDKVFFITARPATSAEKVTETLRKLFETPDLPTVIFVGYSPTENLKINPIKEHDIKIFYGDSDADIEAALAAGARPVRILRAANSLEFHTIPQVGAFNEEVVRDSDV